MLSSCSSIGSPPVKDSPSQTAPVWSNCSLLALFGRCQELALTPAAQVSALRGHPYSISTVKTLPPSPNTDINDTSVLRFWSWLLFNLASEPPALNLLKTIIVVEKIPLLIWIERKASVWGGSKMNSSFWQMCPCYNVACSHRSIHILLREMRCTQSTPTQSSPKRS